jgi:glycosyltransferase involved in cell wall biosynthesis
LAQDGKHASQASSKYPEATFRLFQINLHPNFGGGEVYTAFLCRALSRLGVSTRLLVHPHATFWDRLGLPADTECVAIDPASVEQNLPGEPLWLLSHGPLPAALRAPVSGRLRTAIAHMPVQGRDPTVFAGHERIYAVSGWVRDGLKDAGLPAWDEPLYGVADFFAEARSSDDGISRTSRYDWDRHKGRDRLLGVLEPLAEALRAHPPFVRRDGLTLGIVSRLTPIKQFPRLFAHLAPVLARHREVHLEIFGSGGYASVRDLDRALAILPAGQVRFWGQQGNVASIYRQLDYLLSGLPEKEALGLNIIEAQACGTPVIAVDAPPFTETIRHGETGFLYRDPRQDAGAAFGSLLDDLLAGRPRPHPELAQAHLARFSFDAFVERLRPLVADAERQLSRE